MDHEQAERLISERLDGERIAPRALVALERHLDACAECRAFERGAWRLRESARFEVAPAVPDLVEPIMTAIEAETGAARPGLRVVRPMRRVRRRARMPRLAPLVAVLLVGALAGSLVVGGPWTEEAGRPGDGALAAEDVTRGVAGAATGLEAYAATFTIVEHHLSPEVPLRELRMRVWFRAPERFRLDVVDRTDYPSAATPTDLRLIVNGDAWYSSGPAPCPSATCPQREFSVRNRVPFSSAAPAPTDLVLPLTVLADPMDVTVVGRADVLGRSAVVVEVPFERAAPLFPFLTIGGEWRPFFPNDRVRIWLDDTSWFPLRWQVFPAGGAERDAWALRFGLPEEPSRDPVFEVRARSVELAPPADDVFETPAAARTEDQGARAVALEDVETEAGFVPVATEELGGLDLYRVVIPGSPDAGQTLLTYADGLSFVKVGETRTWAGDAPFGPVDRRAEEVMLAGGGVAYYEPATAELGRRLSIHAAGTDLFLESNLPRERLLAVASTLRVVGLPMPESWRVRASGGAVVERVTLAEAAEAVAFPIATPAALPPGYALASVELVRVGRVVGVTLFFRDPEVDVGSGIVRLHLEAARALPPASAAQQSLVRIGPVEARWTPSRARIEWVTDGLYVSVDAPGASLSEIARIAASLPARTP